MFSDISWIEQFFLKPQCTVLLVIYLFWFGALCVLALYSVILFMDVCACVCMIAYTCNSVCVCARALTSEPRAHLWLISEAWRQPP